MMTRAEITEKLTDYLEELFETPREKILPDTRLFEDLDIDSIDAVDLMVKLQEWTSRRVTPEEFKMVRTVSDIVDCVEKLLAADDHVTS